MPVDTRAVDLHSDDLGSIAMVSELSLQYQGQIAAVRPDGSAIADAAPVPEHMHMPQPAADDDPRATPEPASKYDHGDAAAMCDKCSDAVHKQRLERTRARNRAAQARYRQKMKAECDEVEGRIHHRTDDVTKARSRFAALKQTHAALQRRLAAATAAQLAVRDRERRRTTTQTPESATPQPSATGTLRESAQHSHSVSSAGTRHAGAEKLKQMSSKNQAIALVCAASGGGRSRAGSSPLANAHRHPSTSSSMHSTPPSHAWCPPSTQHAPSASLFSAPAMAPPPLASFLHHTAMSYADLLEASGSAMRVIEFSGTTAGELLSRCMAQRVARLSCNAGEVAWYAQMEYEAAPGLPLSYSCTLSTPECAASCAMVFMVLYLEAALISTALGVPGFAADEVERSLVQHAPSTAASKRACWHGPPLVGPHLAAAGSGWPAGTEGTCMCGSEACALRDEHPHTLPQGSSPSAHMHGISCGGQPTTQAERSPMVEAPHACVAVRCGVNQLCCSHAAAQHIVRTVYERYRGRMARAVLHKLIGASRDQIATILDSFLPQGPLDTSADTGRRSTATPDRASTGDSADSGCDGGGSPTAGGGVAEAEVRDAAAGSASSWRLREDSAAAEVHSGLTVTVVGMLRSLCRALEEVLEFGDEQQSARRTQPTPPQVRGDASTSGGRRGRRAAPAVGNGAELRGDGDGSFGRGGRQELEERVHAMVVSLSIGCMLAQRHAPRVYWNLAASAVMPRDAYPDVEMMHVKLYRLLRLSEQQKDLYVANWQLWLQRRTANDEHTSATLQQLASLPQTLDVSPPFMRHLAAIAAGTHPGSSAHGQEGGIAAEVRPPRLLGARGGATADAAAAVRALWTMHEADVMLIAETIDLQTQPGALLEPPQVAQAIGIHLLHGTTPMDFMSICRLAVTERRRGRLDCGRGLDVCLRVAAGTPAPALT